MSFMMYIILVDCHVIVGSLKAICPTSIPGKTWACLHQWFPSPPPNSWLKSGFPSEFRQDFCKPLIWYYLLFALSFMICQLSRLDVASTWFDNFITYLLFLYLSYSLFILLHLLLVYLINSFIQNLNCGCHRLLSELCTTYTNSRVEKWFLLSLTSSLTTPYLDSEHTIIFNNIFTLNLYLILGFILMIIMIVD